MMGFDEDQIDYQDGLHLFNTHAHFVLGDLKYLCEMSDKLGNLTALQRAALGMAWEALNEIFPKVDHQDERRF